MEFPNKNTGVGCHFLLQRIYPVPGIEPKSLAFPASADEFLTIGATWHIGLTFYYELTLKILCLKVKA